MTSLSHYLMTHIRLLMGLFVMAILTTLVVSPDAFANGENGEEPENNSIWCETDGDIVRGGIFTTEGECEFIVEGFIIDSFFDVEIQGNLVFGENARCRDASTELTIFIDDNGLEGTITIESEGESCRSRNPPTVNGDHDFTITGATGDFDFIVGGSGKLFTEMDSERNFDVDIHGTLEVVLPQIQEVHCEVDYDFETQRRSGNLHGYGECIYTFTNGLEIEHEVHVSGEFEVGTLEEGFRTYEGTFHIEDESDNTIWLDEVGFTEADCDVESEGESEEDATPFCLETDVTVESGEGIFSSLTGDGSRTTEGFFVQEGRNGFGHAYSTIWIFFDVDKPQVVEVHCGMEPMEVGYHFELQRRSGELHGYGECVYIFTDGSEQEHEVHVSGEFEVGTLEEGFRTYVGTFHIEDENGSQIWLDEVGFTEPECDIETSEEQEFETPFCLETDVTVESGQGIFSSLTGDGTRTAEGYFTTERPNTEGFAYTTIWIFFDVDEEQKPIEPSGGGGCDVAPTFGTPFSCDSRNFVDDGVTIHGTSYDPTNQIHIENPRINAIVGIPYSIELKPYDSFGEFNIKWVGISFGLIEGDFVFGNGEALVYLHQDYDGTFSIEEDDDNNIINVINFVKSRNEVCAVSDNDALCPVYRLDYSYNQAPIGSMVGVQVVNQDRGSESRFFNDGIDVTGDSLNPSPVIEVLAKEKFVAQHYLTYADPSFKDRTVAIDENGTTWYQLSNGVWYTEHVIPDKSCKTTSSGFASHCPEFAMMMQGQELVAQYTLDTMYPRINMYESFYEIDRIFAYEYPTISQRELTLQSTLLDWYSVSLTETLNLSDNLTN